MTSYRQPIFIVSAGRSGSMMIAEALSRHPELSANHEPCPHLNAVAYASWARTHPRWLLRAVVYARRVSLIRRTNEAGRIYIESAHFMSHLIKFLRLSFNARFIHIYRNGRSFVRSGLVRNNWYSENNDYTVKERVQRIARRISLTDIGRAWDDHKLEPPQGCITRIERIAWLWSEINQSILCQFEALPTNQYFNLRLEDFNQEYAQRLLSFCGARIYDEVLSAMVGVAASKPNKTKDAGVISWSAAEEESFVRFAGPMMERLGYE